MSNTLTESTTDNFQQSKNIKHEIIIGYGQTLTLSDVKLLAQHSVSVKLNPNSYVKMNKSYNYLKMCVDHHMPIYGVNTNFGDQVGFLDANVKNTDQAPSYESISYRQENLIRSMACSAGNIVSPDIIRVTMMLRAHCLSQGYSGVNPESIEAILAFLNAGIIPIVRQYGSIGASGDLIPLSSIAACIIGEDVDVLYRGETMKAPAAMKLAGLKKLQPKLRDGLAMINGTSFMTSTASLAVYNLKRLYTQMLSAIAMSLESMLVISSAYHPLVHQLKNQSGEKIVNQFLITFWEGSQLLSDLEELRNENIKADASKSIKPVQDYYSVRSVAQGFGPFHENLEQAIVWIENEMNSVNDNPIIDAENEEIHHGANFMGYYITDSCDILKMNISQASTWLHALLANMVHPRKNQNLPANIVENPGINNGFRSLQLLSAALAVQNRKLAQSHQAYTLPTEGDNQDVNSLGTHAAQDLQEAVANLERLTGILFLASAQALEFRGIEKACTKSQAIVKTLRQYSPRLLNCRPMSDELIQVTALLRDELI
ncbi:MAG: aromatic amino acid ammonia-lyase [Gammaproteobacteria bacterium]|nr:aromatic amino acid ammonia-lyase [Gammaproteobacteria bacterium]